MDAGPSHSRRHEIASKYAISRARLLSEMFFSSLSTGSMYPLR